MAALTKLQRAELVDQLFDHAFNVARDPLSPEYKAGARAVLNFRVNAVNFRCPHLPGSAQADAFYAGVREGHEIWRAHQAAEKGGC